MQEISLPSDFTNSRIHLVGIKGTGMAALTEILVSLKAVVSGSDVSDRFYTDDILEKLGIKVLPFSQENITSDISLVIYSAAYDVSKNADLIAAKQKKIPIMLYTEALGNLSKKFFSCAISGVHGKTSTTGIAGTILSELDLPAEILSGSAINSFGGHCTFATNNFNSNADNIFVAETCEYKKHFLSFSAEIIVITSVESDHQDFFPTYESMRDAFVEFAQKLPQNAKLIYCADDAGATEVAEIISKKRRNIKLIAYGQKANGAYKIAFGDIKDAKQFFKISIPNKDQNANTIEDKNENTILHEFAMRVPGRHEALDAAAAVALCCELLMLRKKNPCDYVAQIKKGLLKFSGGKRRSEIIAEGKIKNNPVIIIDDYAHHPTAIKTTLAGFRDFFKDRKIIVDFMSHTYSRTASLLSEFADSFESADEVILHKIYASAREAESCNQVSGKTLFEKTKSKKQNCVFYFEEPLDCVDFVISELEKKCESQFSGGYLFVTMGAGDNWKVAKSVAEKLELL